MCITGSNVLLENYASMEAVSEWRMSIHPEENYPPAGADRTTFAARYFINIRY